MCFDAVKRFRFPRVFPQGERKHGICRVWEAVMVAERYASNLRHRSTCPETSPAFSPTNLATSSPILKPTSRRDRMEAVKVPATSIGKLFLIACVWARCPAANSIFAGFCRLE